MEDITLVIPAKNEKESLPSVLDELSKYNIKKIVVLEKSDVQTIDAIKHYDLRILFQSIICLVTLTGRGFLELLWDDMFFNIFNIVL